MCKRTFLVYLGFASIAVNCSWVNKRPIVNCFMIIIKTFIFSDVKEVRWWLQCILHKNEVVLAVNFWNASFIEKCRRYRTRFYKRYQPIRRFLWYCLPIPLHLLQFLDLLHLPWMVGKNECYERAWSSCVLTFQTIQGPFFLFETMLLQWIVNLS